MSDSMEVEEIEVPEDECNTSRPENRRRSMLWKYFKVIDEIKAKCNFCGVMLSYKSSISNLKLHLQRKHHNVVVIPNQIILKRNKYKLPKKVSIFKPDIFEKKWDRVTVKVLEDTNATQTENVVETIPIPEKTVKEPKIVGLTFGSSDFSTIADKTWYVDKTLFVRSILSDCDRLLITAPKRCGKTTNMNTLKRYVEVEVDKNGDPIKIIQENKNVNSSFMKNMGLFTNKKVLKGTSIIKNGRYPVLHVSFKNVTGDTFQEVFKSLRRCIHLAFMDCKYLNHSRIWNCGYDPKNFERYLDPTWYTLISEENLIDSLRYLSELLSVHFASMNKVYVLIDELDTPVTNTVYNKDISKADSKKCVTLIKSILSNLLKDNPYVERFLAMGTHHYADILISECNVIHKPYLQSDFSKYFGFTSKEVEKLLADMDLTDSLTEVKVWYNSYGVNLSDGSMVEMFNNWSILQYLYEKELKNYQPLGDLRKLKNVLTRMEVREKIEILMSRRVITVKYRNNMRVSDVLTLKRMLTNSDSSMDEDDTNLFFQYLYEAGYLNLLYRTEESIELGIPNIEIYSEYCRIFFSFDFFRGYYNVSDKDLESFAESLDCFKSSREQHSFVQLANGIKNLFSNTKVLPQNDFELQAPLFYFIKRYFSNIKGEALTMPKRYLKCDIGLPLDDKVGIVMEITTFDRGTSLDALSQIVANKYNEILSFDCLNEEVYIGLHMGEDRKITVSYLINNFDLAFANTVCSS